MRDTLHHEIDDIHFVTHEYDFDEGWPLFCTLFKLLGKPFLTLLIEGFEGVIKEFVGGEKDVFSMDVMSILSKIDKSKVIDSIDSFVEKLDPELVLPLTDLILAKTEIVTPEKKHAPLNAVNKNKYLKGKYGLFIRLIKDVLKYQYSQSFQQLSGLLTAQPESGKTIKSKVTALSPQK